MRWGGAALGIGLGYVGYRALLSIDDHPLELLITLALAMFTYAVSFWIDVSGPIAVVVAGLLIGNPGLTFAMSTRTKEHVEAFWNMADELLNAVLFLLIGLEFLAVPEPPTLVAAGLLTIPIALTARLVSVAIPVAAMSLSGRFVRGIVPLLTWSELRGGISVAMVLSLPRFPARDLLLACTYAVVIFSILVQEMTMRRVLACTASAKTCRSRRAADWRWHASSRLCPMEQPLTAPGTIMVSRETTMRLRTLVTGVVAASATVMLSAAPTLAGQEPQRGAMAKARPQSGMAAHMAAQDQTMMADREKMTQDMARSDQRLGELVATMNAASGTPKTDATAAVVSEMVTERQGMRDRMLKMQDGMMAHMMEHMQAGPESMATCPMTTPMSGMKR